VSSTSETKNLPADSLRSWATAAFISAGLKPDDAATVARLLVQTSLWGIDSHGIARLPHYLERLSRGSIIAQPALRFEKTAAATGSVDGGHGHGILVATFAMDHAIALARESGVGIVGIRNSSHCGAIGLYTRQAAESGMIGIAFAHFSARTRFPWRSPRPTRSARSASMWRRASCRGTASPTPAWKTAP
jgi:ureidoglycolate dehydrogenase (NAD+)